MTQQTSGRQDSRSDDFAQQAQRASHSLVREMFDLIRYNKKWWLIPIIVLLLVVGVLVALSATTAGLFIYPLM